MPKDILSSLTIGDKILLTFFVVLSSAEKALYEIPTPRSIMRAASGWDPECFEGNKDSIIERTFYRLFSRRFIGRMEEAENRRYKLTAEGLDYLFQKFPQLRIRQRKFDGFWRIIVYDIEETERRLRNQVRKGLKSLGFRMIQKSVWASPYDWEGEIDEFLKKIKLEKETYIFQSKLSEDKTEKLLKSYWPDLAADDSNDKKDINEKSPLRSLLLPIRLPKGLPNL